MSLRCKTSDPEAAAARYAVRGFSLIEVVLAVGIVAFAIVAIIALFGSSLESGRQVTDEDEALGIVRALPAYLQQQSFSTVYGWIASSATTPVYLYAYNVVPAPLNSGTQYADSGEEAVILSSATVTTSGTTGLGRAGRLFAIQLTLSPNMPLHLTAASTTVTVQPTAAQLPSSTTGSTGYGESILPIRAALYTIPTAPTLSGTASPIPPADFPVFSYDAAVSR